MKIIIAGSGDTGIHLARMLSGEGQDVTLLSTDSRMLGSVDSLVNLMVSVGDPTSMRSLREAGTEGADLFVAVSPDGTANIVACQLARSLGCSSTVARVESSEFTEDSVAQTLEQTGVDVLVHPETIAAQEIAGFLETNWAYRKFSLHDDQLHFTGVRIAPGSPAAGKSLRELQGADRTFHVTALKRQGRMLIPHGDDSLQEGDIAYFTTMPDRTASLAELAGQSACKAKNILISGGNPITRMLLGMLGKGYSITVMDSNPEVCRSLAEDFPNISVVNAEPSELASADDDLIYGTDVFVSLGKEDSVNIVECMMAREAGVRKTVAQIEGLRYMAEAERLGIDKIVNKKLATSARILERILGKRTRVSAIMSLENAEVVEIEATSKSRIAGKAVKDQKLPHELTLGGLVRGGSGMLVGGDTVIEPGDLVMVVFMQGSLGKVEKLFR